MLLEHISKVINHTGTKKISSKELKSKINSVYFNPNPIHKYIKRNTKDKAFLILEDKIVGYFLQTKNKN